MDKFIILNIKGVQEKPKPKKRVQTAKKVGNPCSRQLFVFYALKFTNFKKLIIKNAEKKCNYCITPRGNISPSYYCIRQVKVAKSAVYDTIKRYKELGNNTRPSQNWSTKNGAYSKEN